MLTRRLSYLFLLCCFLCSAVPPPAFSAPLEIDLDGAIELAFRNNRSVKIASADVTIAGEGRRQAYRAGSITATVSHRSSRTEYQSSPYPDYGSYVNLVEATLPIYTGGRVTSSIAAAEAELSAQKENLTGAYQDLRLSVASAFFTVLRTDDMAKLSREAVERLQAHVDNVSMLMEAGRVGRADLLRSEVELFDTERQMINATNQYEVAIKQLNDLMGLPLDTPLRLRGTMSYVEFPYTLEECIADAMEKHPKLTAARWIVEQSKAGVQVAASAKRPQASITMTQTLSSTGDWPGFTKDNFVAALQVQYTLLDAGLASSQIAEAKENVSRASLNRDSVADSIKLSVTTDFMGTQEAALRIKKTASALDKARESYEISVFRYDQGVGTNIDVIDAQIALTQANSNYTQALCDYNIAVARLENSMGGLPARTDPEFDKKPKDKKSGGE